MNIRKWNELSEDEKWEWEIIGYKSGFSDYMFNKALEIATRESEQNTDPEIIGRVMRWKGNDYFHLPTTELCDVYGTFCNDCKQHGLKCSGEGWAWELFKNILVNSDLSELKPYVMVRKGNMESPTEWCRILIHISTGIYVTWDATRLKTELWDYCRLANIDDLKKAGITV